MQVRSYKIRKNDLTIDTSKKLGSGKAGATYVGEIMINGRKLPVAIKQVNPSVMNAADTAEAKIQLKREQRLFELLGQADNVIKYYGHLKLNGHCAIVMQFANKGDLDGVLSKVNSKNKLSLANNRYLITDIANGLSQLHSMDIIHCDLKPANVLVTEDTQGNLHAKIADLGLSKAKADSRECCGSPIYSAPEVLLSEKQGKKSDVYSTSFIMWEILAAPKKVEYALGVKSIDELCVMVATKSARPIIYDNFPRKVGLWMERSWSQQAKNRPTSAELATAFNALTDDDMQKTYQKKSTV